MLTTILNTLGICRIDVLLSHSGGTWLNYKAAADLQCVKSSLLLNPLGKRTLRPLRPFVVFKLFARLLRNPFLHSKFNKSLPFIYKFSGFKLAEEDFSPLPVAVETIVRTDYEKMQGYAEKMSSKKHPFVMATTQNDQFVEIQIAIEMAQHMGIEEGEITEYSNGSATSGDAVGKYDDTFYRRVILFEKGGHLVHKINETEIVQQILQLVAVVSSH
ncbi:uncharacterized protein LOC110449092 isoform X2 [Mizuhopecten yessoensis]|uniref:AB hydrolase-1 domain-containing protein n=2 Tax=Mizuhopecten yessoensis TaxID=6573 RepID=A0A210QRY7_MIZYE|nr:uncharacterized protein LOC110449092 isoform X2 [Mizuhopecten yessoensis]OWF51481.1 hypothetical protein KP79_PYT18450 [Mizuhopecten yessoensis]